MVKLPKKHIYDTFNPIFMLIVSIIEIILQSLWKISDLAYNPPQIFSQKSSTFIKNANILVKSIKLLNLLISLVKSYLKAIVQILNNLFWFYELTLHKNILNLIIGNLIKLQKCLKMQKYISLLMIILGQILEDIKSIFLILILFSMIPLGAATVANCLSYDPGNAISCIACNSQYHLDSSSSCGLCIDSWCDTCSQSGTLYTCTQCISGFYMPSGPTSGCTTCPMSNCNICIIFTCTTCNNGYVAATDGTSCNICINFMPNCLTCTNSSVCTVCAAGYVVDTSNQCSQCAITMFGCTSCSNLTVCQACHTDGYFLPSNDTICQACSKKISNCSICDYFGNNCTTCNANFMLVTQLNQQICLSCSSVVPNCASCGPSLCTGCIPNYTVVANNTCQLCSYLLANCSTCISSTICFACLPNTIITFQTTGVRDCQPCGVRITGCLQCISSLSCDVCASGYYLFLNINRKSCSTCSSAISACVTCKSSTICTSCSSNTYALNITNKCQICSSLVPGCSTCLNSSYCLSCISDFYYLDQVLHLCLPCSFLIPGCIQCTQTVCLVCEYGFYLNPKLQCLCKVGSLIHGLCINVFGCNSIVTVPYIQPICNGCSNNLILINNSCSCPNGKWFVTGICTDIIGCITINSNNPSSCIFCNVSMLMVLAFSGNCECKPYFYLSNSLCLQICGDGNLYILPCDDGNTISGDGCSSTCQIESGYTCTIANNSSKCIYNRQFIINLIAVKKIPNIHSGEFIFRFTPKNTNLAKMNFIQNLHLSIPDINITVTSSYYINGLLFVSFDYGNSIQGQNLGLLINFDSSLFSIGSLNFSFPIKATGLSLTYIVRQYFFKIIGQIFLILSLVALGIFFISLPLHKMIGVETIQVFQVFFMILLILQEYEQPFNALESLHYVMGYFPFKKYSLQISIYASNFYNKLGVVKDYTINQIIISPVTFFLGFVFLILLNYYFTKKSKIKQSQIQKFQRSTIQKLSYFYRIFLFPFVIGFSFSSFIALYVQMVRPEQYISQPEQNEAFVPILVNMAFVYPFCLSYPMIVTAQMIFSTVNNKSSFACLYRSKPSYIIVYLAYSFALIMAFLIGYQISNQMALYFITTVIVIYTVVIIKSRPYQNWIHNVSILINQISLLILVITLLYRNIKATSYQPFDESDNFLVILLYLSILILVQLFALVRIFFQLKRIIKKCCKKQKLAQNPTIKHKPNLTKRDQTDKIIKQYHPNVNPYRFINQILKSKRQDWYQKSKIRQQNGLASLEFDEQQFMRSQFFMQRNAELISSKQKTAVLNHINMDGYFEHFERNQFTKLKETVRQNLLPSNIDE